MHFNLCLAIPIADSHDHSQVYVCKDKPSSSQHPNAMNYENNQSPEIKQKLCVSPSDCHEYFKHKRLTSCNLHNQKSLNIIFCKEDQLMIGWAELEGIDLYITNAHCTTNTTPKVYMYFSPISLNCKRVGWIFENSIL